MEDNSWKLVDLTENASSNSAAAKRAAGETRSRCEKSPVLFGEFGAWASIIIASWCPHLRALQ